MSREGGWSEVSSWKDVVKGLGCRYDGAGSWEVPLFVVLRRGGEVRGFVRDVFGEEGVRRFNDFVGSVRGELERYRGLGYLIVLLPGFIDDVDAYRIVKDFRRYADSSSRHYLFFTPQSFNLLKEKYGPNLRVALERLERAGAIVVGEVGEVGKPVVRVVEGRDGEVVFDTSNPVVRSIVVNAVKEAVKGMGGSNFSLKYYKRGVDDYGRPELRERKFPLARFLDGYDKVAVKAVLVPKVVEALRKAGFEVEGLTEKGEWVGKKLDVELRGVKLRPYQEEAIKEWLRRGGNGVVVLPTGGGKTIVALAAMAALKVPTLIVVPTTDLVRQWRERISKFFGIPEDEIGVNNDVKPITIVTYAKLARDWRRYLGKFGLVITDETHHVAAETYMRALSAIDAPYRLGLTATPERQDKNTHVIEALSGKPVIKMSPLDLMREGYLAPVKVEYIEVNPKEDELSKYRELRREARNASGGKRAGINAKAKKYVMASKSKDEKILELLGRLLKDGRKVIIFCEFVDQVKRLAKEIKEKYGDVVSVLYNDLSKKRREEELRRFREGKARVLVASPAGNEGLDIPSADTAIFASFKRSEVTFLQRIGRVIRPLEGKISQVYVIYTPQERDLIDDFREYVKKYIPQDKVDEIITELAMRAREAIKKEAEERVVKEVSRKGGWRSKVRKHVSLLTKDLPPDIKAILNKTPRKLTREEKIRLIEYVLSVKGPYAFKQDVARQSRRKARWVRTWLKHPSRSDLPGVDTPDAKKLVAIALRRLRRERKRELAKVVS